MSQINKPIYNINEFKYLKEINKRLLDNLILIQEECDKVVKDMNEIHIKRKEGEWSNDKAHELVDNLSNKNEWMYGWTQKDNWKNFLILFNSNIMYNISERLPTLYNIINDYKDKFNVVGLSLLEPHSTIPYHYDVDTHIENNRLVYHFNIFVPNDYNNKGKSIISIWDKNDVRTDIEQLTGNHLIFDNSYYHSVNHDNPEYRLVLFTDIKVSEMI
jgi:hypothetical protein